MPLYEYRCQDCDRTFERLVRRGEAVVSCPHCGGERVERLFSVFARPGGSAGCASCARTTCQGCGKGS